MTLKDYLDLENGRRYPVVDGMVIGRVKACEVVLHDEKVSRRHARLIAEAGVVEVEDLDSRNGVFLNGKKVKKRVLRDGDVLRIGRSLLTFVHAAESASPAVPSDAAHVPDLTPGEDLLAAVGDVEGAAAPVPDVAPGPTAPPAAGERAAGVEPHPTPTPNPTPTSASDGRPSSRDDDVDVIEFVDEVVEVRRRPAPAAPAARLRPAREPTGAVRTDGGVLQFQGRNRPARGALGDDLSQVGGPLRGLWILLGILVALAVGVGAMLLVGGG